MSSPICILRSMWYDISTRRIFQTKRIENVKKSQKEVMLPGFLDTQKCELTFRRTVVNLSLHAMHDFASWSCTQALMTQAAV